MRTPVAPPDQPVVLVVDNDELVRGLAAAALLRGGFTVTLAVGGQQAVAVVMTDEATPKVESMGLVVDGNALAVSDMMGVRTGSAGVKVDGNTYTISGEAQGADMKNPTAGMITKAFTITVTCS